MEEQHLTYQQILAEQYSDSARNALVFAQSEFNVDDENDVDADTRGGIGNDLEDQAEYGKFAGNRNTTELLTTPSVFEDKGKTSVRYNKDVRLKVLSIDSRFRAYANPGIYMNANQGGSVYRTNDLSILPSTSTNFVFRPNQPIKNAMSMKLTSLELPNKFYNIFASKGNDTFWVRAHSDSIGSGFTSYTKVQIKTKTNVNPDLSGEYYNNVTILDAVRDALNSFASITDVSLGFVVDRDPEGRTIITSPVGTSYDYYFPDSSFNPNPAFGILNPNPSYEEEIAVFPTQYYPTLPEILGFQDYFYGYNPTDGTGRTGIRTIVSEDQINMNTDNYIYLSINDYDIVTPQGSNNSFYTVFAKIPVNVDKGKTIFDTEVTNTTTKTYRFLQPTDIYQLEIRLLDNQRNTLQVASNMNYSMTLEIEEVVSHSLYEKLREL